MSEPILKVEGVQAKYGDFIAVESATLDVPQGMIVSVIGANGAGKSTLMDTIAGVHKPTAGKVYFKGEDITGMPAEKLVTRGLSLVPQGSRCFIRMTVEDNLIMGSYPKSARGKLKESLERVYELFPVLKQKRNDLSGSLSGGQRQMVAIGRALMTNPDCVLFDDSPVYCRGAKEAGWQVYGVADPVFADRAEELADLCGPGRFPFDFRGPLPGVN